MAHIKNCRGIASSLSRLAPLLYVMSASALFLLGSCSSKFNGVHVNAASPVAAVVGIDTAEAANTINSTFNYSSQLAFAAPLFGTGMILQRGDATRVWGTGAAAGETVTVSLKPSSSTPSSTHRAIIAAASMRVSVISSADGTWEAVLPAITAQRGATLMATGSSGSSAPASIGDVSVGDVLLCGGQSNMGFGMCGATSATQTPQQALDAVGSAGIRVYFEAGSGPNGGAGHANCKTSTGQPSITTEKVWFTANASNAGGTSAVCLLTAQYLAESQPNVPVGMVESCIGGTNVEPWTPPAGSLFRSYILPLQPFTFRAALWDQGEADAKRTNSTWYATEFPRMIVSWREGFKTQFPFVYVELCTEYGAEAPKESDFYLAQRAALKLPATGFATTTDIQRALHPPDKQDVARRLLLSLKRIAYGEKVVSRGPEVVRVSSSPKGDMLAVTFSNSSMSEHAGILVGNNATCAKAAPATGAAMQLQNGQPTPVRMSLDGDTALIACNTSSGPVHINWDQTECFLYGPHGLPAPPFVVNCTL